MDREEIHSMAAAKAENESFFFKRANHVKFIVWAIGLLCTGLIISTGWVTKIGIDVSSSQRDIVYLKTLSESNKEKLDFSATSVKVKAEADGRLADSLRSQIDNINAELKRREPQNSQITDLWFMKEHNIFITKDELEARLKEESNKRSTSR